MVRHGLGILCVAAASLAACVEKSSSAPSEKQLQLIRDNVLSTAPTPKRVVNADLDGKIVYIGCDYDKDTIAPGEKVTIKHYFRVVQPTGRGWKLFQHLNGEAPNANWVNIDHKPVKGAYQVSEWKAGEIIRDEYVLTLPKSWSAPVATVHIGVYKGGDRLKVLSGEQDGQNRIVALKLPVSGSPSKSAGSALPDLIIKKTAKAPVIDGKLDDAAWATANGTGALKDSLNGDKVIEPAGEAKVLWDDQFLYVGFTAQDTHVWSDLKEHDAKLWTQDVFEVFLDADGDGATYVELQVNPNNATFDSYLPVRRGNQDDWNAEGMKTAVFVDGDVAKKDGDDKAWSAEMAIPWAAVRGRQAAAAVKLPPALGQTLRANFFRFDLGKSGKQVAAAWSATVEPDFHNTARFGKVTFADEGGVVPPAGSSAPGTAPAPVGAAMAPSPSAAAQPLIKDPEGDIKKAQKVLAKRKQQNVATPPGAAPAGGQ